MNLVPAANTGHGRLLLLAPADAFIPETLAHVECNPQYRSAALAGLQRLRGQTYLEDGAIDYSDLEPDGRFIQDVDERAWHLISMSGRGEVRGCARYIAHTNRVCFAETTVSHSPLSRSVEWGSRFREAVESEIGLAGRLG